MGNFFRAAVLMAVGAAIALALLPLFPPAMAQRVENAQHGVLRLKERLTNSPTPVAPGPRPSAGLPAPTPAPIPSGMPRSAPGKPELKPTPTPASQERGSARWIGELERQIHGLVNAERTRASLSPLTLDASLSDVARLHSQDMAVHDYFAHENLAGLSPSARADKAGYACRKDYGSSHTEGIGENLFQTWLHSSTTYLYGIPVRKDYLSVEELARQVVDGWMDSPGHHHNVLEARYDKQGIGVAIGIDEKVYVAQDLC